MVNQLNLLNSTIDIESILKKSIKFLIELNDTDLKILETLYEVGPRNILKICKITKIPKSTVYNRLGKLRSMGISIEPVIIASKIGLSRVFAIVDAYPGRLIQAYNALARSLWAYKIALTYEPKGKIFVKFYMPYNNNEVLNKFLTRMQKLRLIKRYKLYEVHEELYCLRVNRKYVDANKLLTLPWNEWYEHMVRNRFSAMENVLPINILKNPIFAQEADSIDIKIIERLQINAFKTYVELGKELNLSPTTIRHHYIKHITGKGIIVKYVPRIMLFHPSYSKILVGILSFTSERTMLGFLNTLWNSPILGRFSKVLHDNSVVITLIVPKSEELRLLTFLELLTKENIIHNYELYPVILSSLSSWTIPAELFNNGSWLIRWDLMVKGIKEAMSKHIRVPLTYRV